MDAKEKFRLQKNRRGLVDKLIVRDVMDDLISDEVLNSEDVQIINSKTTTQDQTRCLLDILPSRGKFAYCYFRRALKRDYQYLVDLLDNTDMSLLIQRNAQKVKIKPPLTEWFEISKVVSEDLDCLKDWRIFGRALGLPESDIVCVSEDNARHGPQEAVYQLMLRWKSRMGQKGTADFLCQNLRSGDFECAADKIEGYM